MIDYRNLSLKELISTIICERRGEEVSSELCKEFSTLRSLLIDATEEELLRVKGLTHNRIKMLKAASEVARRLYANPQYKNTFIKSPQDAANILIPEMRFLNQESFRVILLNIKCQVIDISEVSKGSLSSSIVHPRETFALAIKRYASSIIVAHNHPSGDPTPSSEDITITNRLVEAGNVIGIKVNDHIIIGSSRYLSFAEKGLI